MHIPDGDIDLLAVGEALVDFISVEKTDSLAQAQHFEKIQGGSPANIAVNMAKLGGKTAGVMLAYGIIQKKQKEDNNLTNIKLPRTWYIASDAMIQFMYYNNLEEMLEQKYKPLDEVRKEYPHVVQLFKNSHFPQEIVQGVSMALDEFGNSPVIVRSSSILEDRLGSAFSGKYKSEV